MLNKIAFDIILSAFPWRRMKHKKRDSHTYYNYVLLQSNVCQETLNTRCCCAKMFAQGNECVALCKTIFDFLSSGKDIYSYTHKHTHTHMPHQAKYKIQLSDYAV